MQDMRGRFYRNLVGSLFKCLIAPVAVLILAGVFVWAPHANVTNSAARAFFDNYFSRVTQANQRHSLYQDDLTQTFRSFNSWSSYVGFWRTQKFVLVNSVIPAGGAEYRVSLMFHPRKGGEVENTYNFWFACESFLGGLSSRVSWDGCPTHDLEIDNQQLAR